MKAPRKDAIFLIIGGMAIVVLGVVVLKIFLPPTTNLTFQSPKKAFRDYSVASFTEEKDKRRILFFCQKDTQICKEVNEDFEKNESDIPKDVVVFKVDFNSQLKLREKYKVTADHTFIQLDAEESVVARWAGGDFDDLLNNLK